MKIIWDWLVFIAFIIPMCLVLGFIIHKWYTTVYTTDTVYVLKDGVMCLYQDWFFKITFKGCDDGFVHVGEPYKIIHNRTLREKLIKKIKGDKK